MVFLSVGYLWEMTLVVRTESALLTERRGEAVTLGVPPLTVTLVIPIPTTVLPISPHPEAASMEEKA